MGTEKRTTGMKLVDKLSGQLGAISVAEAVEMLMDMNCADEAVLIPDDTKGNRQSSPWLILDNEDMEDYPAAGCIIIFCGGPPGNQYWYTGSLLSMVVDKLLYKIVSEKLKLFSYERPWCKLKVLN